MPLQAFIPELVVQALQSLQSLGLVRFLPRVFAASVTESPWRDTGLQVDVFRPDFGLVALGGLDDLYFAVALFNVEISRSVDCLEISSFLWRYLHRKGQSVCKKGYNHVGLDALG